jgi:signal transduction histidine kinase
VRTRCFYSRRRAHRVLSPSLSFSQCTALADALRDSAAVEIGLSHARTFEEERKSKELAWRNAALEQEKTLAETASQAKSEFLAVMSHEIRYTILTR